MSLKQLPHNHNDKNKMNDLKLQIDKIEDFAGVSDVFKQLGDPTRLRIFWLLCHCTECVTDIAAMLDMSSPAVSHHLRILKSCDLITGSRSGKEVYYKVSENTCAGLLHNMIEQVMEITCPKNS